MNERGEIYEDCGGLCIGRFTLYYLQIVHICTFRKLNSLSSGNVSVREIKSCLFVDGKIVGKFIEVALGSQKY